MARKARTIDIRYNRPFLFWYQKQFVDNTERFTVVEACTKVGKTVAMIVWLLEQAIHKDAKPGQQFWWVAPVRAQAKIAFDRLKRYIPIPGFFTANETNLTLMLPNGAIIAFKSADNADTLYGDDVYAAVFDEYTRAQEVAWFALRSTLTSTGGKCKFIGNVRGRGWGYKLAQKAKNGSDPNYAYFKATAWDAVCTGGLAADEVIRNKARIFGRGETAEDLARAEKVYQKLLNYAYAPIGPTDTKNRLTLDEVLQAKSDIPDYVFRELYEAEPSDDGQNPFGITNLDRAKRPYLLQGPVKSLGVDLASTTDFTVEVGLNANKAVCHFNRYQLDWETTTTNLASLPDVATGVDATGVGKPILERMQKNRKHTVGFIFSSSSKQLLIEALATAFQMGEISYPEGGALQDELYSFEYVHTRTGIKYSAPAGLHDDCVMALALAYDQHRNQPPVFTAPKARRPERKRGYFS